MRKVRQEAVQSMTASVQQRARFRGSNYERRIAKKAGGVVVGRSKAVKVGDKYIEVDPQHPPDVLSPFLAIECKHFKDLPVWLTEIMNQAVTNADRTNRIPVAWLGDARCKNNYVIIRESDWIDLHGPVKEIE